MDKIEGCYIIEESKLRRNLSLIKSVKERAGVDIILAFKAFAMWRVFPIVREYIGFSTASSLAEARLAFEEMGSKAHTYAPAYTDGEFPEIARYSSHITFNSLTQFHHFKFQISDFKVSCGLRINPEFSEVETELYNPCARGSRLGIIAEQLPDVLPEGVSGLHFHTLCESSSYDLEKTLQVVEQKFGKYFHQITWLNMGGGHLMTRADYDVEHLIALLKNFKAKYPHLQIILEPGSAFAWQSGFLLSAVTDIVENHGIKTAMLDVSFACHMPDCLEIPYQPEILYTRHKTKDTKHETRDFVRAKKIPSNLKSQISNYIYRMGGNSCLSGDYLGSWEFERELQAGDKIIFEDMIHYTTVKTTMFNGVTHPSIGMLRSNGEFQLLRKFEYEDYKNRMN
ncbi:MAG: carboxynorspermidine decarboxylase [Paludibacter sp.]|jgi:carboxynorspermidine decarboxylase|nr:carboxynorspermidine decarboxylase [Paludibacter sp.]